MALNLYGEKFTPPQEEELEIQDELQEDLDPDVMLQIDMNETDLTLFKIIQRTKDLVEKIQDDKILGIYLVSGFKEHNVYDFWDDYFEYVETIQNRKVFIYRGYLHFQNLKFLMINNDNFILKGSKIIYDSKRLHEILNSFSSDLRIYNNFCSSFFGTFRNFHYFVLEDLGELQKLGFNFKIL